MAEKNIPERDFRHIVRIANTDLDGSKPLYHALNKIKGVSFMFANALCIFSDIDRNKKAGHLTSDEVSKLDSMLKDPLKFGFPVWMLNRRKDVETGADKHLLGADLRWQIENDVKLMKKIRSYKGVRHMSGLPVRGQKTKGNFRKKKGKGKSLGVQRKKPAGGKGGAAKAGAKGGSKGGAKGKK
ncbi:30S ribosomal protein S13 [Candidatus Woesearchaeota archaeon]|jgi:small subunit ribosomal protein S13|nr:30S ribosomal protein S13 [Candidatus Woesearchaeota archaeon]